MIMNDELKRMWNKSIVTYFKVLSQHSLGEGKENQEKP
jgi:hypothetical protein